MQVHCHVCNYVSHFFRPNPFGHTKQQEHQRLAFCIPILIDPSNVSTSTLNEEVPEEYCPVNLRVSEDTVAEKHIME